MMDPLLKVTMPDGSELDFVEVPPHASGDRQFRVRSKPPHRMVWNFRALPLGAQFFVEGKPFVKTGATGEKLRLRAVKAL